MQKDEVTVEEEREEATAAEREEGGEGRTVKMRTAVSWVGAQIIGGKAA